MDGKGSISDYRSKMDRTLSSPDLTNHEKLQILVRNQILQSSDLQFEGCIENVVEKRSKEVSNFLGMLRSTALVNDVDRSESSEGSSAGWKVKQDTEEFRVMYREGPEGTPYHTLLVEGYVDGPLDVCLCISWESGLYNKWWPQTAIPTFKVISSRCLQKVGDGEQISLVRMKVSWPLSSREAVIHYFAFEYFQDDLMVVLLNSISESEMIERRSHGFTKDGIPEAEEVVRIDVVGGFALQKVTANRSYFRTIANMDIKLDFVPPSFINFVSRQLVGSGFKLYKKAVSSVSRGDQKFCEALKDPLYARIREALDSESSKGPQIVEDQKRSTSGMVEDGNVEENSVVESEAEDDVIFRERNELEKIEELKENDTEGGKKLDKCSFKSSNCSSADDQNTCMEALASCSDEEEGVSIDEATERCGNGTMRKKVCTISPEVEKALVTLEKAISIFKEKAQANLINGLNLTNLEKKEELMPSEIESSNIEEMQNLTSVEARINSLDNHDASRQQKGSNNCSRRETNNHVKIAPDDCKNSAVNHKIAFVVVQNDLESSVNNKISKNKKYRFCCLHFM